MVVNGHKVDNPVRSATGPEPLIINSYEHYRIPRSSKLIANLTVRTPFQGTGFKGDHLTGLKSYAIGEGNKLGGNVIKITHFHNLFISKYLSSRFTCKIYHFDDSSLADLKNEKENSERRFSDSIKNVCIVHIQDYCHLGIPGRTDKFYLNDQLIGTCHGSHSFGLSKPLTVVLKRGGRLSSKPLAKASAGEIITVELGKEYFLKAYNPMSRGSRGGFTVDTSLVLFKNIESKSEFEYNVKKPGKY
jgi:hypothetical protein